jgi:integrase
MADYLIRRNGRYSFRRRYPNEVAAILGKTEFVKALGTADPKEAAKLARQVNVIFDNECEQTLFTLVKTTAEPFEERGGTREPLTDGDVAKRVLDGLPGIIRKATESVIAEQARNKAGWTDVISWQRKSLEAQIAGQMPRSIAMHPLEARAALDAINAAARGELMNVAAPGPVSPTHPFTNAVPSTSNANATLDQCRLDTALAEYAIGKSHRRKMLAQRQAGAMLRLPCTQQEAMGMITEWCKAGLSKGKQPSSVWTEASAVNALLKYVLGWHEFTVPKVGELRQLKGAGKARRNARASMPVGVLHDVLKKIPSHLPRNGAYWHAALLLCALYGFRPSELLGSGIESLQEVETIWSDRQLVFRVGLNGAKNESSKRDLPVPAELRPLFELALSRERSNAETTKTRVDRLNALVSKAQGNSIVRYPMYSVRHLFADIARDCGYADAEFGPLMGHRSAAGMTAIYGGTSSLEIERSILKAVQDKLFPDGLEQFWPTALAAPKYTT